MIRPAPLILLGLMFLTGAALARSFIIPKDIPEEGEKRLQRFESFQIKGVCGDQDLERLSKLGVNTVRGYTIGEPATMIQKLDEADRLGMKMILSEWMPHHGKNKNKDGNTWDFDYEQRGDKMVDNLMRRVEGIGDHPAILMWGLGNEVHLDEPYLRVVNRMSEAIHQRFPHHLISLTMINAKPDAIAAVKKYAPDLYVLGIQSYSRGAVRGAIKKTEELRGKPFYLSEFNTNGPWNFGITEWGVEYDEPVTRKVTDLLDCYAAIDASPLCLGSTIFVWGTYSTGDRPTYFGLLLDTEPEVRSKKIPFDDMLLTPQADVMTRNFTGRPPAGNQAPVLSLIPFENGATSTVVKPGELITVRLAADDADGDTINFTSYILQAKARKTKVMEGPFPHGTSGIAAINAPQKPGEFLLLAYARDS